MIADALAFGACAAPRRRHWGPSMSVCIRTGPLALAILAGALGVQPAVAVEPVTARPHPVGLREMRYEDATRQTWTGNRPRPLVGAPWYPAQPGTTEVDWDVAIF